jgi:membrane fusion protein, heavy metal efflux system
MPSIPARSRIQLFAGAVIVSVAVLSGCSGAKGGEGQATDSAAQQSAAAASAPGQPGLFTLAKDQLDHVHVVQVEKVTWSEDVETTGTVDWDADHTTSAITQVNGPITRILVDLGSKVKAGDPLLYVSSPDVANAVSAYRKARNREDFNKRIVSRQKELLDRGAVAVKDYESNIADMNDAMTDVQDSLQALKIFGITQQEIDQAEQQGKGISTEFAVRAPIAGMIVEKLVSPGQLIQAGTTACFTISDPSTVWVQGHIFDRDLSIVQVGDTVDETSPAVEKGFRGTLGYIGALVDADTRTTPVRIVTPNPQGLLKKDMFLNAVIHTRTRKDVRVVPVSALLRDAQNEPIVFVETEPGKFAQRSVKVGIQQHDRLEILDGLQDGDKVVAEGSLFLQFANTYQ